MTEILILIPLLFLSALESHASKPLRKACSNVTMDWERREVSRRKCGSAGHILKGKDAHLHFLPPPTASPLPPPPRLGWRMGVLFQDLGISPREGQRGKLEGAWSLDGLLKYPLWSPA